MKTSSNQKDQYWNPVIETLPLEKLRSLQFKKFKRILEWAYERSKFHRKLYQEAGLEPGDIKSYEDVAKVPKVEKAMMRDIQRKDPFPYGDALCVPLEEVTEFRQTSGTTGTPVYPQPDTWQDWEWWAEAWAYLLYAQRLSENGQGIPPLRIQYLCCLLGTVWQATVIAVEVEDLAKIAHFAALQGQPIVLTHAQVEEFQNIYHTLYGQGEK